MNHVTHVCVIEVLLSKIGQKNCWKENCGNKSKIGSSLVPSFSYPTLKGQKQEELTTWNELRVILANTAGYSHKWSGYIKAWSDLCRQTESFGSQIAIITEYKTCICNTTTNDSFHRTIILVYTVYEADPHTIIDKYKTKTFFTKIINIQFTNIYSTLLLLLQGTDILLVKNGVMGVVGIT